MNTSMKSQLPALVASMLFVTALLSPTVHAQINMSAGTTYTTNFDSLANSGAANLWVDNTTLQGWFAAKTAGGISVTNYRASTGSDATTGSLYSFGSAATPADRALGSVPTGTPGDIAYGVCFTNDTASGMTNFTITYTGEQWRRATNVGVQTLAFTYFVNFVGGAAITNADAKGTNYAWKSFGALDFNSPNTVGASGGLDGNASTNRQTFSSVALPNVLVAPGQEICLRWLDVNDADTDHGLGIDDFTVTFTATAVTNTPPGITTLSDQTIQVNQTTPALAFTVSDGQNPADSLTLDKDSSNTAVIPLDNISFGGSGSNRTITVSAGNVTGTSTVTIRVSDLGDLTNSTSFLVTVIPSNSPPVISQITPTNTLTGIPVVVPFTVFDAETAAGSLAVTRTSLNTNLVPTTSITLGGSGSNRTATITPAFGRCGVAIINLTVSDNTNSTATNFAVMVRPSPGVVLIDDFDYPNGPVIDASAGLWQHHSGTAGDAAVTNGTLAIRNGLTEDVNAGLIGAPYTTSGGFVLYSSFKVTCIEAPTTTGTYFSHFKDTNTGAAAGFGARVWNSKTNATQDFRFGIGNGINADNLSGQLTDDLFVNTNYLVVTRFDPATGVATIWLNPASENSPGVTATDVGTVDRPNPIDVVAYAFRQNTSEGKLNVDNLRVGLSFADVMPRLNLQAINNQAVLTWAGPHTLQAAPAVTGTYTNVPGVTSPFTNSIAGAEKYFRLKY